MISRSVIVVLVVLAVGRQATADLLQKKKVSGPVVEAAVSGVRMEEQPSMVKHALGLVNPTTAPVVPAECKSALQLVQSSPNFTFLATALKVTGLESAFANPGFLATIFAPNDLAFTEVLDDLAVSAEELFAEVAALSVVLKYHVIPGRNLEKSDFKDDQPYVTLLTDKKKNKYEVIYNFEKVVDLKDLKSSASMDSALEFKHTILSSGAPAKVVAFDINQGCPTIVHVIDRVLIPDYKDQLIVDAADQGIALAETLQEAGALDRYQQQYAARAN